MDNNKYDVELKSLLISIGIVVIAVIFVLLNDKAIENKHYNKLLEDYGIIKEDKDRQDMLIYDKETKLVYKSKYVDGGYGESMFDIKSYFASNGLPYKYNEETKGIEMIEQEVIGSDS